MLITDFWPLQSTSQFNEFMNENWMNVFTWDKDYWNIQDKTGMRTDFVVQYSILEDLQTVSINLKWRNTGVQYWYCDFSITRFKAPINQSQSESGLQWWVWLVISLGVVVVIAIIITIILVAKKKKNKKKKAQVANNRQK